MAATFKASEMGLDKVDLARRVKGWAKGEQAWYQLAMTSAATLKRFWARKAVQKEVFVAICKAVGIEAWEEIAEPFDSLVSDHAAMAVKITDVDFIPHLQENRCPDCLFLQLEGILFRHDLPHQVELILTLNFNEQWEDLGIGRVKFGIRGGELRLNLTNGKIPYGFRKLVTKACYLSTKGSEEKPVWEFKVKTRNELILKFLLNQIKLAILQPTSTPVNLEAIFEISMSDLIITDIDEIIPSSTHVNKQIAIKTEIIHWMLQSKIKPYMSRLEMRYV